MTYEEFSLFVEYNNRREQFPRHLFHHSALFQLLQKYTDKETMNIYIKESGGRSSYIVESSGGELYGLATILGKTDVFIHGHPIKPKYKMLGSKKIEIIF